MKKPTKKKSDACRLGYSYDQYPAWYWRDGLHDAEILSVKRLVYPDDYRVKNPIRSCMEININAKGALFESKIKKILLYHERVLTPEIDINQLDKP